jgi:hypothetical protein
MYAACNTSSMPNVNAETGLIWEYINDPNGTDTTGAYYFVDSPGFPGEGHLAIRTPNGSSTAYEVNEGWSIREGYSEPQIFQQPWTFALDSSPSFAGTVMGAWDNSYQPHPSYDSTQAPTSELWFLDVPFFTGGIYKDTATLLSGTLYQYNLAGSPAAPASIVHYFNPNLPYFGISNANWLLNISGPGSLITGTSTDNYKMCVVQNAGECVSGSSAGNIYFNVPTLTDLFCRGGETAPNVNDICIQNYPTYGEAVDQFGFAPANLESSGSGGSLPLYGAGNSRAIVSGAMLGPYRELDGFSNAHALPDGSWAIFGTQIATPVSTGSDLLLVKLPPTPSDDGIDRTNFENVTVNIGNPGGSATHARIKYGYEENGPESSFFCAQRPETCYSTNQNLALNSGQILQVGIPQRVLFYQVEYLDSSNNVVATDPVSAVAIP